MTHEPVTVLFEIAKGLALTLLAGAVVLGGAWGSGAIRLPRAAEPAPDTRGAIGWLVYRWGRRRVGRSGERGDDLGPL